MRNLLKKLPQRNGSSTIKVTTRLVEGKYMHKVSVSGSYSFDHPMVEVLKNKNEAIMSKCGYDDYTSRIKSK